MPFVTTRLLCLVLMALTSGCIPTGYQPPGGGGGTQATVHWGILRWDGPPAADPEILCETRVQTGAQLMDEQLCLDCEMEWFVTPAGSTGTCEAEIAGLVAPHRLGLIRSSQVPGFPYSEESSPWSVFTDYLPSGFMPIQLSFIGNAVDWDETRSYNRYELELYATERYEESSETWLSIYMQLGVEEL